MAAKKATTKSPTTTKRKKTVPTKNSHTSRTSKRPVQEVNYSSPNSWFNYSTTTGGSSNYNPTSREKGYTSNLRLDYAAPKPEKETTTRQKPDMKVIQGDLIKKQREKYFSRTESDKIVDYAIKTGISDFIKRNPEMQGVQNILTKYVDQNTVRTIFGELYGKAKEKGRMSSDEARDFAYSAIREYIGGGELLDTRGKKILIRSELEKKLEEKEKGLMFKIFHHNQVRGRKYMNKAMDAFDDLSVLLKTGDYQKRMPEITKAVDTLYDLKFLEPAIEVLKEYNLIGNWKYNSLKRDLYRKAKSEAKTMIGGIESYVSKAAAIIGFLGILLTIFNLSITGNVIGGDSTVTLGIIGIFMIFFALLLSIRPLKKALKSK